MKRGGQTLSFRAHTALAFANLAAHRSGVEILPASRARTFTQRRLSIGAISPSNFGASVACATKLGGPSS
jgi:hypothetical protein